ncbi:hypothetical protein C8Q76DRAFT_215326 [Earliella scabrosa]|nr:hypothetical protein C8Q76DRAFT_215326 [Earliella scabrosa]
MDTSSIVLCRIWTLLVPYLWTTPPRSIPQPWNANRRTWTFGITANRSFDAWRVQRGALAQRVAIAIRGQSTIGTFNGTFSQHGFAPQSLRAYWPSYVESLTLRDVSMLSASRIPASGAQTHRRRIQQCRTTASARLSSWRLRGSGALISAF